VKARRTLVDGVPTALPSVQPEVGVWNERMTSMDVHAPNPAGVSKVAVSCPNGSRGASPPDAPKAPIVDMGSNQARLVSVPDPPLESVHVPVDDEVKSRVIVSPVRLVMAREAPAFARSLGALITSL